MRRAHVLASVCLSALTLSAFACSGSKSSGSGFNDIPPAGDSGGGGKGDTGTTMSGDSSIQQNPDDATLGNQNPDSGLPDGSIVMTSTIYANTDTMLYSMDPTTQLVTPVGIFAGLPDAAYESVTDCAVDAEGDVYVNTESAIYKATLPSSPSATASVPLTLVATINAPAKTYFYALAFAPAGLLGSGETLVGGDSNGELWSINPMTGATQDIGNFGPDSAHPGNIFALSGDIVFYTDSTGTPTGLATIRSCDNTATKSTCIKTSDFLAGIDMTALAANYTANTSTTSLLKGIYGGSSSSAGPGTGYGSLFGLGAWGGEVFAFSRNINASDAGAAVPPQLLTINTTTGAGAPVAGQSWTFTDGWSGAGVTTKVTINIPKPPPPPQ